MNYLIKKNIIVLIKKVFLISIILTPWQFVYSQTNQTYSGPYKLTYPFLQNGTAIFSYKEDAKTHKMVKNGKFSFKFLGKGNYHGYSESIQGEYKNNKKNGKWTYTITTKDFKSGKHYLTGKIILTANYLNGLPNGLWNYTATGKSRKKVYDQNTRMFVFGKWRAPNMSELTAQFEEGELIGKFYFIKKDDQINQLESYTYNIDANGMIDGSATKQKENYKSTSEYDHGFLYLSKGWNLQSGQSSFDDYSKKHNLVKRIMGVDSSILISQGYSLIKTSQYPQIINDLVVKHFFSELFHYKDIRGDVNFEEYKPYKVKEVKILILLKKASDLIIAEINSVRELNAEVIDNRNKAPNVYTRDWSSELNQINQYFDGEVSYKFFLSQNKKFKGVDSNKTLDWIRNELESYNRNIYISESNGKAWIALINNSYPEAKDFCNKGLSLSKGNLYLEGNLAHAYLLNNEFEIADSIYMKNIGKSLNKNMTWTQMVEQDFTDFKKNGIENYNMERVLFKIKLSISDRKMFNSLLPEEQDKFMKKELRKAKFNDYKQNLGN